MDKTLSKTTQLGILNLVTLTPSQESTSVSVVATCGSYTIVNNNLIIAAKLANSPPTLQALLTPISPSDMGRLLTGDQITSHSEEESIPISEQDIVQDDEYYLSMIGFEFGDVQFLVPKWGFPATSTLSLPTDKDTCTITWDDVSALDFRCLMEFMYPLLSRHIPEEKLVLGRLSGIPEWYQEGCIGLACGKSQLNASHEATIGIDVMVKIARARDAAYRDTVVSYHKQFPDLASFINEVPNSFIAEDNSSTTRSSIIDDICTAQANGLSKWLQCCYERLIDREESITLEEATTLGLETTIGIWKARLRLFEEYRHILKMTQSLNFTRHIESELSTELQEARRLQDIFGPAPSMAMSMSMEDFFDPQALYMIINLKFNTCLDGYCSTFVCREYDGSQSQLWSFQRTESSHRILNSRYHFHLCESKIFNRSPTSGEPNTFLVGRASSDEPDVYGIFLSEFLQPTTRAVRMEAQYITSLDPWDSGQIEGWKWKIVTAAEARKHFGY